MTYTKYTKLILNIKDENIYFDENCLEIGNYSDYPTSKWVTFIQVTLLLCIKQIRFDR